MLYTSLRNLQGVLEDCYLNVPEASKGAMNYHINITALYSTLILFKLDCFRSLAGI